MARSRSTALLTLLVAFPHFAGAGIVGFSGARPAATEYFCCCLGECHCTADCCNHAPAEDVEASIPTVGAGSTILDAPRSCGIWTATLDRSPTSAKALPGGNLLGAVRPPDGELLRRLNALSIAGPEAALQPLSPRAPPIG